MNKGTFFLVSLAISVLAAFLSGGIVIALYKVYNLPIWVRNSATDVFLASGAGSLFLSGAIYVLLLFLTGRWGRFPLSNKVQSLLTFVFFLFFSFMFAIVLFQQAEKISALF